MSLYKDEKGMPFMNFKIVKVKKLKMECKKTTKIWHIYSLRFWVRSFGESLLRFVIQDHTDHGASKVWSFSSLDQLL